MAAIWALPLVPWLMNLLVKSPQLARRLRDQPPGGW
jgi:hypothetical protein